MAGKGTFLCICFGSVDGTIADICRHVLNKKFVYSQHARVSVNVQSVILPNGLIINLLRKMIGRSIKDMTVYFIS